MTDSTLTEELAAQAAATASPITGKARIQSIDTLRGVALLGILLLNIIAFANPFAAYMDPRVDGATAGIDLATFMTMDILFEGSMRAIFSMLFGAGLLIFMAKPNTDPEYVKGLFYRRTLLLVAFGLFNAYILVWAGDILYGYGMAGLVLFFFRDFSARKLALYSAIVFVLLTIMHSGLQYNTRTLKSEADAVAALPAGTELSDEQQSAVDSWIGFLETQAMTPELIQEELETKQAGYVANFIGAAKSNIIMQTITFVGFVLWDVLAMMLLGMAFWKWGLFDASRSLRVYMTMLLLGFGIGIPLNYWETLTYVNSGFEPHWIANMRPTYDIGRLSLAMGYIGLVMVICKIGVLGAVRNALAKVGQMALTNYLSQSLICNVIFMGFGFGLAGELARHQIYYVVIGVWIFQLVTSSLWLRHYRFGPAEWLWRSMTYKKIQTLKLETA